QAVIAAAEDFGKDIDGHECKTGLHSTIGEQNSSVLFLIWMKWGCSVEMQPQNDMRINGQLDCAF
ncbi:MAG: hypothetical protein RLY95_1207, partial [Pseudomonadota bacterium]